jgi:hypothetical protein
MPQPQYIKYNLQTTVLQKSDWYDVPPLCNGFTVTNIGDTICTVNDQIFYPGVPGTSLGDSRSFGGNANEVYKGNIKVAFANPAGAAPQIEIVYKTYSPEP